MNQLFHHSNSEYKIITKRNLKFKKKFRKYFIRMEMFTHRCSWFQINHIPKEQMNKAWRNDVQEISSSPNKKRQGIITKYLQCSKSSPFTFSFSAALVQGILSSQFYSKNMNDCILWNFLPRTHQLGRKQICISHL